MSQIEAAPARAEVDAIRAAMSRPRAGTVTSQGDFAQGSSTLRTTYPTLTGSGIIVGVLSDSFDCYAAYAAPGSGVPASGTHGYARNGFLADAAKDMSTTDLPASINVLKEAGQGSTAGTCKDFGAPLQLPYADEGRAMAQIVHDVAPGASLAFHTAVEGEADFANGITALAAAGAKVIADDVGYFDEPFFQDGIVAQAIDSVAARGVTYFSAAGNEGQLSHENSAPSFSTHSTAAPNAGEYLLNFDASGATTTTALPVTIPPLAPGEFVAVVVQWDQPYMTGAAGSPGASSHIDLCAIGVSGNDTITGANGAAATCTGPNATGVDPVQILIIGNPANATGNTTQETLSFNVGLANGTAPPGRVKVVVEDNGAGSTINAFDTHSPTLQGHPGAAGAAAVGAGYFVHTPRCGTLPAVLEPYSSAGGDPILFDTSGSRLATPVVRQKPNFVGPDGVSTTFFGFVLTGGGSAECQNNPSFPSFFGTSAATPHAAGVAALMLQANPAVTPAQIVGTLQSSAAAMGITTPDFQSGHGFIQADAALALLPPAGPTISFTPTSITVGMSSTLTWSGVNVTGCTASGSWSGAQAISGSQTITASAAGNLTYTLTCSNAVGSAKSAATLAVQAAPASSGGGGGGGGGDLDAAALLALASLACVRLLSSARPRCSTPN